MSRAVVVTTFHQPVVVKQKTASLTVINKHVKYRSDYTIWLWATLAHSADKICLEFRGISYSMRNYN
jgi:hypothetical protein